MLEFASDVVSCAYPMPWYFGYLCDTYVQMILKEGMMLG